MYIFYSTESQLFILLAFYFFVLNTLGMKTVRMHYVLFLRVTIQLKML